MNRPSITSNVRVTAVLALLFVVLGLLEIVPAVLEGARDKTSDIGRQWVVTQYALRGVNPFPVGLAALRARYGVLAPRGPVHLKDTPVYAVPTTGPHPQTDPLLGPAEATYPPWAIGILLPLGFLPRDVLRYLWMVLNIALLFVVARELRLLTRAAAPDGAGKEDRRSGTPLGRDAGGFIGDASLVVFAGLVLLWPPTSYCIASEQFSLLCLACILIARRLETAHPLIAGLMYGLSAVKPSLALPFLLLPLLDGRWKTLASLAISQLALWGATSWLVHTNSVALLWEWMSVAAYFRQGMFTVQDVINKLRLDGSWLDIPLQLCILGGAGLIAWRFNPIKRIAFLAAISCIWTYHGHYDFVTLLIPAALLAVMPLDRRTIFNLAMLVIVGVGLSAPIYLGKGIVAKGIREAARLSLPALLVGIAWSEFQARQFSATSGARLSLGER